MTLRPAGFRDREEPGGTLRFHGFHIIVWHLDDEAMEIMSALVRDGHITKEILMGMNVGEDGLDKQIPLVITAEPHVVKRNQIARRPTGLYRGG